jgi:hypothetical protein
LHEMLPLDGYLGGVLVIVGAVIHTWGSAGQGKVGVRGQVGRGEQVDVRRQVGALNLAPTVGRLGSPVLILVAGALLLYKLHGLPISSWDELSALLLRWPIFQQQGLISVALLMMARSLCWLVAWGVLCVMVYRAVCSAALALRRFPTVGSSTTRARLITSVPFDHAGEERLELDVRVLRQMGVTPYALTSLKRKEAQNSRERLTVQRRRKDRRERLMSIESAD